MGKHQHVTLEIVTRLSLHKRLEIFQYQSMDGFKIHPKIEGLPESN